MKILGRLIVPVLFLAAASSMVAQFEVGSSVHLSIVGVPAADKAKFDSLYSIGKEGTVTLPFIGEVKAAGKNSEELAGDIRKAYVEALIYTAPTIQVASKDDHQPNVSQIHIGGQVRNPGQINYEDGVTLGEVVKAVGGATEFGSLRRVKVYRGKEEKIYDLTKKENALFPLEPNDTVDIPMKVIGCF